MDTGVDLVSLLLLSVGLAMDAFSVATVTGFGLGRIRISDATRMSVSFGLAHVVMPVLGWLLGSTIVDLVSSYDHWVAFLLLLFVGGRMVKEGLYGDGDVDPSDVLGTVSLIMFTVAVSIDALAVGLSFRLEGLPILVPSLFMGAGTLLFTFVGLLVGNRTGKAFGKKAQVMGGLVLIGIGARIVFTHLV
jgi:putative Mn2+ efflux pump MntP